MLIVRLAQGHLMDLECSILETFPSRSKYISTVLREKVLSEKERQIKDSYNRVFSDDSIKKEQLRTAIWFDGAGNQGGQEW